MANRVGAVVSRRRGVLVVFARELAPRKIYRCSVRAAAAAAGCAAMFRAIIAERKARRHLFRLYDAGAPFVWNSYAALFISSTGSGSQLAGAHKILLIWCGHERSFSKGQREPIFSADVHLTAFDGRRSNPTRPPASKLVIETHTAAGLWMWPSHTQ